MYRDPLLQIFQEFEDALASGVEPLFAIVAGTQYALHRFSEDDEQAQLGEYDRTVPSTVYAWPDHVPGAEIETTTAEIILEDAKLLYYTEIDDVQITVTDGNRVKSQSGVVYVTNTAAARDASFGTRDVQVGDPIRLSWIDGPDPKEHNSVVAGFVPETVPGTTNPDNVRAIGFGDTTQGSTESTTPAPPTRLTTSYNVASYSGLAAGYPTDTYTVLVTAVGFGTASGGTLDGTKLKITSAGNDTIVEQELGQAGAPWGGAQYDVVMGSRGAVLEVVNSGGGSINVGDFWTVVVSQNYAQVDVTAPAEFDSFGPYTGSKNTQYILTCTSGGTIDVNDLTFSYTTSNGADVTGTLNVLASLFPPAQNDFAIGNNGMQVSFFATTQWNTGDVVVFDVVGETAGAVETIIMRDSAIVATGTDMTVQLFTLQEGIMDAIYSVFVQDDITISGNATVTTNILGTEQAHEIWGGIQFVDYRELDVAASNTLGFVNSVSDLSAKVGPDSPLNPLGKGTAEALRASAGVGTFFIGTAGDSLADFTQVLGTLTEDRVVHGLVPLSNDEAVKELVQTHVIERSNEDNNQWRIGWIANNTKPTEVVADELSGGGDILATIAELSLGQYRQVNAAGATFITDGVGPGDTLRINFSTDSEGNVTYDSYVIDRVDAEEIIILVTGPPAPIAVPLKIEVWRTLTNVEYAEALAEYPTKFDSRRMFSVWADNPVDSDGETTELFYVACALAGQRSAVPPHAPLTNVTAIGVDLDPQFKFSRDENNIVGAGGNWIVSKDFDGRVFTRHQLSTVTNPDDLIQREQTFTTNTDNISRDLYNNTLDLVGQGNVSPDMLALIRQRIHTRNEAIRNTPYSAIIGPQIIDVRIVSISIHPTLRDTIIAILDYDLPAPLNRLEIHMNIGVA